MSDQHSPDNDTTYDADPDTDAALTEAFSAWLVGEQGRGADHVFAAAQAELDNQECATADRAAANRAAVSRSGTGSPTAGPSTETISSDEGAKLTGEPSDAATSSWSSRVLAVAAALALLAGGAFALSRAVSNESSTDTDTVAVGDTADPNDDGSASTAKPAEEFPISASGATEVRQALADARARWAEVGITSYQLSIAEERNYWTSGCTWTTVVVDGEVADTSVESSRADRVSANCIRSSTTVEDLHDRIAGWANEVDRFADFEGHTIEAVFDKFGVPKSLRFDLTNGSDEESTLRVTFASAPAELDPAGGVDGPVMYWRDRSGELSLSSEDALLGGVLQLDGDCLLLGRDSEESEGTPILWPFGYRWSADLNAVLPPGDGLPIALGEWISGAGGHHSADNLSEFTASAEVKDLATTCASRFNTEVAVFQLTIVRDPQSAPSTGSEGTTAPDPAGGVDGPVMYWRDRSGEEFPESEAALLGGVLRLEGDCLFLGGDSEESEGTPILWPFGYRWSADLNAVLPPGDGLPIALGDTISGGGGNHILDTLNLFTESDEVEDLAATCTKKLSTDGVAVFQSAIEHSTQ